MSIEMPPPTRKVHLKKDGSVSLRTRSMHTKKGQREHEEYYWREVQQGKRGAAKRKLLDKEAKIAHLRNLGTAREPFETRMLHRLEGRRSA